MMYPIPLTAPAEASVSTAILRAVEHALLEQGLTFTGEFAPLPAAPETPVAWDECMARLRHVLTSTDDPTLGLRTGERATMAALHVVGHMLLSCRSLREASELFLRFSPLVVSGARFVLREEGDRALFTFHAPSTDPVLARFCSELAMTLALAVLRLFPVPARTPRLLWVSFEHTAPPHAAAYEAAFGCAVRFDASETALVFPRAALDATHALADDALRELLSRRAETLLSDQTQDVSLTVRVKTHLRRCNLDDVDAASAAQAVGVTPSTLRRRLSQEGTTFSTLIDDVRRELALSALRDPSACIKVLSEQLGFSEPCAFHRAFRRWTGTTPARYRLQVA